MPDDSGDDATNLKVTHWGSLNSTPLQYSMVLSWIPDSGKSGMGMGVDLRSPANRGWGWGRTPDPRRAGDRGSIPDPRRIGDGDGDGDRGFRALPGLVLSAAPTPSLSQLAEHGQILARSGYDLTCRVLRYLRGGPGTSFSRGWFSIYPLCSGSIRKERIREYPKKTV